MPHAPMMKSFGLVTKALGERQVRVVVSTDQIDRSGDIVVQKGIQLDNFRATKTILWNHDQDHPVACCVEIGIENDGLAAVAQFPPQGTSAKADEVYGLLKAGVINAASIGFMPLEIEPVDAKNPRRGERVEKSELYEFSFVSIPANPGARVVQRAARPATRGIPVASRKGFHLVSELAWILHLLGFQVDAAFEERLLEGDASEVPEQLKAALEQLGAAMIAMTQEEVGELIAGRGEGAGDNDRLDDLCGPMLCMSSVFKRATPALKAGRVFSAATAGALRGHLKAIGEGHQAICKMIDEADGDSDDLDPEQKQRRVAAARLKAA